MTRITVTGWSVRPQGYVGLPVVGFIEGQKLNLAYEGSGKRVRPIPVGPGSAQFVPEHRDGAEFGSGYRVQGSRDFWLRATTDLEIYVRTVQLQEQLSLSREHQHDLSQALERVASNSSEHTRTLKLKRAKDAEVEQIEHRLRQLSAEP